MFLIKGLRAARSRSGINRPRSYTTKKKEGGGRGKKHFQTSKPSFSRQVVSICSDVVILAAQLHSQRSSKLKSYCEHQHQGNKHTVHQNNDNQSMVKHGIAQRVWVFEKCCSYLVAHWTSLISFHHCEAQLELQLGGFCIVSSVVLKGFESVVSQASSKITADCGTSNLEESRILRSSPGLSNPSLWWYRYLANTRPKQAWRTWRTSIDRVQWH